MVTTRSASRSCTPAASLPVPAALPKTPSNRGKKAAAATTTAAAATATAVAAAATPKTNARVTAGTFMHAPSTALLAWLFVSLPLVVWDTGYVLGRPHTMPGGWAHKPLWGPYDLYGRVDHVYGQKAWDAGSGFTGAQSFMNVVETGLYFVYLWMWYANRSTVVVVRPGRKSAVAGAASAGKQVLQGRVAARALLICFAAAVMTLSKTALYWCNEYYSSFDNIGHNTIWDLILLWIIPNGAWIVLPAYIIYELGSEIVSVMAAESIQRS